MRRFLRASWRAALFTPLIAASLAGSSLAAARAEIESSGRSASEQAFALKPGDLQASSLGMLERHRVRSLTVSVQSLLGERDEIYFDLEGPGIHYSKTLHCGDPDLYFPFTVNESGEVRFRLLRRLTGRGEARVRVRWRDWAPDDGKGAAIEAEPNDSWREANPIELGRTVFASGDDVAYILPLDTSARDIDRETRDRAAHARGLSSEYQQTQRFENTAYSNHYTTQISHLNRSVDWYRFEFEGPEPRLVMFTLDVLDRDNIPGDVAVYRLQGDAIEPFDEGIDPVSPPHEVQALAGNKFTTRVLTRGTYYLRVVPNHPSYRLRSRSYPVAPYKEPRQAVRTAMDYIVGAGDSWHANTPRVGGLIDRIGDVHPETAQCIACHATQFSMRAEMTAARNGYAIQWRGAARFLAERLYNNPRPLYGHPRASWSRMISAAANSLNRPSAILFEYEALINGDERLASHRSVAEYLRLYYRDVDKLKENESNGNKPLVSTYEVAFYSWETFRRLAEATGEDGYRRDAEKMRALLEQDAHKDLMDWSYQTIALATIDAEAYREKLRSNGEKILSYQRPSGLWSMVFEPEGTEVEFQTGHCLYALALAGFSAEEPRIAKAIAALLGRQHSFGGWFDPTQAYENFRTPFRETQFAVMALSQFYKSPGAGGERVGWENGTAPAALSESEPRRLLDELDRIWEPSHIPGGEAGRATIRRATEHEEPFVRAAALACLGRVGGQKDVAPIAARLGDESKLVQRAAAWALRGLAVRRGLGHPELVSALAGEDERRRWGASRVLYRHFAALAGDEDLFEAVLAGLNDPSPTVRLQTTKNLSRWWYWTPDRGVQRRIEAALAGAMGRERHPWAARGVREAFHAILDENTRYLYNNWIPLLAREEDRETAETAQRAVAREQAALVASVLEEGDEARVREMLRALSEFHLRDGKLSAARTLFAHRERRRADPVLRGGRAKALPRDAPLLPAPRSAHSRIGAAHGQAHARSESQRCGDGLSGTAR